MSKDKERAPYHGFALSIRVANLQELEADVRLLACRARCDLEKAQLLSAADIIEQACQRLIALAKQQ